MGMARRCTEKPSPVHLSRRGGTMANMRTRWRGTVQWCGFRGRRGSCSTRGATRAAVPRRAAPPLASRTPRAAAPSRAAQPRQAPWARTSTTRRRAPLGADAAERA
eukprot:251741-Pleurochrysis_carterae.AAC.2